jgi:Beta-lactamase
MRPVLYGLAFVWIGASNATAQSVGNLVQRLDSIAGAGVRENRAVGIVAAVVKGNDTLLLKAYGKAVVESDSAATVDTVFQLNSDTKQFTAAAILQLRDRGHSPWTTTSRSGCRTSRRGATRSRCATSSITRRGSPSSAGCRVETEVPMDDWLEVGVFDEGEPYLQKHRIHSGTQTITVTGPHKPGRAGIDPRHVLSDLEEMDKNVKAIEFEGVSR